LLFPHKSFPFIGLHGLPVALPFPAVFSLLETGWGEEKNKPRKLFTSINLRHPCSLVFR
jgi:hypothetical protein